MKYVLFFAFWLCFMVLHMMAAALLIPTQKLKSYREVPKDREYIALHICWYAIVATWFLDISMPSSMLWWALGVIGFALGSALHIWTWRVNPYFSPVIEKPPRVIKTGPYRYTRHPGYIGMILMAAGSWQMLGHRWAIVPFCIYIGLIYSRVVRENDLLKDAAL